MHPTYLRRQLTKSKAAEARANERVDNLLNTIRNQQGTIIALQSEIEDRDRKFMQINRAITVQQRRIRNLAHTVLCIAAGGFLILAMVMLIPAHRGTVPDYAVTIPFILGASAMMLLIVFEPYRKKGKRK